MNTNKKVVSALVIWIFINLFFLIAGISERNGSLFIYMDFFERSAASTAFPFESGRTETYDFTEFFLYIGVPVLIYWLYLYNRKEKILRR